MGWYELLGTCGCHREQRGWGRGFALTMCVNGEGLCGARAPLQAVLEAVPWVVTIGAGHAPHGAAESCRLHHGEGGTIWAYRCEFIDGCHCHEHGHAGCVAHSGSAILAPHTGWGVLPPDGLGNMGTVATPLGWASQHQQQCFLYNLLVLGSGRGFSHLPHDLPCHTPLGTLTALWGLPSRHHHNGGCELEAHGVCGV